jgi:Cu+-exporting ATPase
MGSVEISYRVEGMGCEGCVSAVEGALREIPGVANVTVDLASGSAHLTVEGDAPAFAVFADAVSAAGYRLVEE